MANVDSNTKNNISQHYVSIQSLNSQLNQIKQNTYKLRKTSKLSKLYPFKKSII